MLDIRTTYLIKKFFLLSLPFIIILEYLNTQGSFTIVFFIIASILTYNYIKSNLQVSPLIILYLIYSYANNCLGALLMQWSVENNYIYTSAGPIEGESIYVLPLLYSLQVIIFFILPKNLSYSGLYRWMPNNLLILVLNSILIFSLYMISFSFLFKLDEVFIYLAYGFNKYISFAPLLLGIYYHIIRKRVLLVLLILYLPNLIMLSLVNSRGYAIFPLLAFFLGLIFFASLTYKVKRNLLIVSFIVFPIFLTLSNIGRLGNNYMAAGQMNSSQKVEKIILLLRGELDINFKLALTQSFTERIFPVGGYMIIKKTPEIVNYRGFDLKEYLKIVDGEPIHDKYKLIDYGFRISSSHSIGITLFGDFWMYGGIIIVFMGLLIFIGFIGMDIWLINKIFSYSPGLSVIILVSQFHTFFYAQGKGLVNFITTIIMSYAVSGAIFLIYYIIRKFRYAT